MDVQRKPVAQPSERPERACTTVHALSDGLFLTPLAHRCARTPLGVVFEPAIAPAIAEPSNPLADPSLPPLRRTFDRKLSGMSGVPLSSGTSRPSRLETGSDSGLCTAAWVMNRRHMDASATKTTRTSGRGVRLTHIQARTLEMPVRCTMQSQRRKKGDASTGQRRDVRREASIDAARDVRRSGYRHNAI